MLKEALDDDFVDQFNLAMSTTTVSFRENLLSGFADVIDMIDKIDAMLSENFADDNISLFSLKKNIQQMRSALDKVYQRYPAKPLIATESETDEDEEEDTVADQAATNLTDDEITLAPQQVPLPQSQKVDLPYFIELINKNIHDRNDLYKLATAIGKKLIDLDPQSPIPLMLMRSGEWGLHNLGDILSHLSQYNISMEQFYALLVGSESGEVSDD